MQVVVRLATTVLCDGCMDWQLHHADRGWFLIFGFHSCFNLARDRMNGGSVTSKNRIAH